MRQSNLFVLDEAVAMQAITQFQGAPAVPAAGRPKIWAAGILLALVLAGAAGFALADTPPPAAATASTVGLRHWEGTLEEAGARLLFTLKFEDKVAVVHITGPRYGCTLRGRPLAGGAGAAAAAGGATYALTSNGGLCDRLLGGSMVLSRPAGMSPQQYRMQTFRKDSGAIAHEVVLTETGG